MRRQSVTRRTLIKAAGLATDAPLLLASCAAERMRAAYRERGLPEERIDELVVLDVKPTSHFVEHGFPEDAGQHGAGGHLFAHEAEIMG